MNVLIVFAHPEPESFNNEITKTALATLNGNGHNVVVSDLYQMGFSPVASAEDFLQRRFPERRQYDREKKLASRISGFSDDINTELEKLKWCDLLILQFPFWWFSVPAIMKGWIDRVLLNGHAYGKGHRLETGGLKGKHAMLSFSTGCQPEMAEPDGLLGSMEMILWPLEFGTFAYTGMEVLEPNIAWSSAFVDYEKRQQYLEHYRERLRQIEVESPRRFHTQSDFENFRLKPGIKPLYPCTNTPG